MLSDDSAERFAFGKNWQRFVRVVDEPRIGRAAASLQGMLGRDRLDGASFLDIGSGSGLFSLAARRLGADVFAFDYDSQSVACTAELRRRYEVNYGAWRVEQGSALDAAYLERLGRFDIVYSWGVLHHTGAMWKALDLAARRVAPDGLLFIALYNDQGWISAYWRTVKRLYNAIPATRPAFIAMHYPTEVLARVAVRALTGRLRESRGMAYWRDMVDWLGGYPFEVAKAADVHGFMAARGFTLERQQLAGRRHGCNEFVFRAPIQIVK